MENSYSNAGVIWADSAKRLRWIALAWLLVLAPLALYAA